MKQRSKKLLGILLSLSLLLSLIPAMALTAYADPSGTYREYSWNDSTKALSYEDKAIPTDENVVEITSSNVPTAWENGKTYVVTETASTSTRITVSGTVNLILCDGMTLTASEGINVAENNTLNIYGQSGGTGMLEANGTGIRAGIGGGAGSTKQKCGAVNIHGGVVNATGNSDGAGIGSSSLYNAGSSLEKKPSGGTVTIYNGTVTATAGNTSTAAGIGGGRYGGGGTVYVYGGTVNATGGGSSGAGIGGASYCDGGNVYIYGGTVIATGKQGSSGIGGGNMGGNGGSVYIYGGTVIATSEWGKAGIGQGNDMASSDGTLTLGDGVSMLVSSDNSNWSAYDGSTRARYMKTGEAAPAHTSVTWDADQTIENTQTISVGVTVVSDITVTVSSGVVLTVNGGINADGKTVTVAGEGTLIINGATGSNGVDAEGEAGDYGFAGNIIVDGATVTVTGGTGGIGGSDGESYTGCSGGSGGNGVVGNVTVNSGSIEVTGGTGGNGGGGDDYGGNGGNGGIGVNGTVTVTGGSATLAGGTGGNGGYGFDGGNGGNGGIGVTGTVTVTGGSATLAGGTGGEAGAGNSSYGENGVNGGKGEAVSGTITGSAEESDDNSNWAAVSSSTSAKQYVEVTAAAPLDPVASVTPSGGEATNYTDFAAAVTAWNTAGAGATLKLLADVETNSSVTINAAANTSPLILDLNGYGIRYTGTGGSVIDLNEDRTLKLTDSAASARTHYITLDENGRGVNVADSGTESATCVKVTGGYLTGGTGKTGVSISGGGVYDLGSFTMEGGTIVGNTASQGGGVFVCIIKTFTMTGGTITGNKASTNGGGVCVGGAGTFNLSGGTITGNSASTAGGGVYVNGGCTFNLSGGAIITGNLKGSEANNAELSNGRKITLTGALDSTASIGVTMQTPGVFTEGGKAKDYAAKFTSDNTAYSVMVDGDELKLGMDPVSYIDHDAATGAAETKTCDSYTAFVEGTNDTLTTVPAGWYVIKSGNAIATNRLVVNGEVNLILCDGATLIARKGITVTGDNTLNIYAGGTGDTVLGTGKLYAGTTNGTNITGEGEYAGIGGSNSAGGGTVTIHGGEVTARGNTKAAGIGGGNGGAGGTVTVYGGTVTAIGDGQGKGIGAGQNGSGDGDLTLASGLYLYGDATDGSTYLAAGSGSAYSGDRYQYMTVNSVAPHTHSFTYTASGATITATCENTGCDLTDNKTTFTITAPTLTTYGGTGDATATLDGVADFNTATGKTIATTDIKYVGRDGTTYAESATAPTSAGKYTAKITVEEKTASVNYEIAKAAPVVGNFTYAAPSNLSYDGNNKTATVIPQVGVDGMGDATVKYYSDAARTNEVDYAKNAGTYYVGITVNEGDNYNATSAVLYDSSWKFTIGKATPTADNFNYTAPSSLGYDGTAKSATVNANSGATGMGSVTVKYYSDAARTNEVDYAKNAGTYYVGITVNEGDNYNATTSVLHGSDWTFTIGEANAVAATVTANSRTYDGTEKPLVTVTGEATGGEMQYALGTATQATEPYTTSIPSNTDAGTYYVWYKVVGDANHNDTEAAKVTVSINKATVTAPTIASKTYTGENQTADVAASTLYTVTTNNGGTNVGSYDVVLTLTDSANYKWTDSTAAAKTLSFQITKAAAPEVTVPTPSAVTYDPAKKLSDITLSDGWAWVTSTTVPTVGNSGYAAALTVDDANYNYTNVDGYDASSHKVTRTVSLTVNKAEVTAPTIASKTYTGEAQTATVTASTLYSVTTNNGGTNVGSYDVVLTLTDSANYKWTDSTEAAKTLSFNITKATAPTVTVPTPSAVTYDPAKTLADISLPDGWAWVTGTTVPTVTNSGYEAALTVDDANYDYTDVQGYNSETHEVTRTVSLTVNKAAPTVTAPTAKTLTYTGTAQELVNAGSATGGTMQYALGTDANTAPTEDWNTSIPQKTNDGTYYVWYKVVGDDNHTDSDAACVTATISAPAATTVTIPVSGEDETVNVKVEVKDDTATVKEADVDKVLEAEEVGTVTVDVSALEKDVTGVVIPSALLEKVADAVADEDNTADGLEVKLPTGSVAFDADAVATITEQADGNDLKLNLDDVLVTELTSAQQEGVSDLEIEVVLDAYLTSGGKRISDFNGGSATVKIPYTLKDGQTAQGIVVWYVATDGTRTQVPASYDGENVVFTVPHFSNYVIAYDAEKAAECPKDDTCPISAFDDADPTAWYHDGVHFVLANGLMNGMGNGKFAPNDSTSRAMIVTILYRLEGEPDVSGMENPFEDVADGTWYTDAVIWAAENKIVEGYGNGKFGPNDNITREQLAAILYRYAQSKGQGFTGSWMFLLNYPDAAEISGWADEAMHWCVMNGIINGKDGKLVPGGNATRAEAATMLMRYCTKTAE